MSYFQYCLIGKLRLKYDMRSYQEMVVNPMKQMSEDNQQLLWLKNKVVKQEQRSKALEETVKVVNQKLSETMEENRIVMLRTKIQHEENKEEVIPLCRKTSNWPSISMLIRFNPIVTFLLYYFIEDVDPLSQKYP